MKTILISIFLTSFLLTSAFAQNEEYENEPQTLFSGGSKITGWYIDFSNSYSRINGKYTYLPGFSAGIVMNNNFRLGLAGKSLSYQESDLEFDALFDEPAYLAGGYGGIYIEASPLDGKIVHISFPIIIGGGGAVYFSKAKSHVWDDEWDYEHRELDSSPFFVVEPGVNLELNVTGFMKIYSGISYRWVNGLNLYHTPRNAFNNGNFNIGLKFGRF